MGHSTAHIRISAKDFDQLTALGRERRGTGAAGLDEVVRFAVEQWRDEDPDYNQSPNLGFAQVESIASEDLSRTRSLDAVWAGRSRDAVPIIPIAHPADVVQKTQDVKLELDEATFRRVQASGRLDWQDVESLGLRQQYPDAVTFEVKAMPKPLKPRATATEGAAETVYRIHSIDRYGRDGKVLGEGATQAEARKKALELAESRPERGVRETHRHLQSLVTSRLARELIPALAQKRSMTVR